jgi:hypothetical protein
MKNYVLDNLKIEITIRNPQNINFPLPEFLTKYLDGEKPGKKIFMVPLRWEGFKNGFVRQLTKSGLDVYISVAFSTTGTEKVFDSLGNEVKPFIHKFPGGLIRKYVKKDMVIQFDEGIKARVRLQLNKPVSGKDSLPITYDPMSRELGE